MDALIAAGVVQPAAADRPHLFYVVGGGDVDGAAGQFGVDGPEHRVPDDGVEAGGAADGVIDAADAAGLRIGRAVVAVPPLPVRVLGVPVGGAEVIAGDTELLVLVVVDGDGLKLVDAGVKLGDGVGVVVVSENEVASQVEFVLLFVGQG